MKARRTERVSWPSRLPRLSIIFAESRTYEANEGQGHHDSIHRTAKNREVHGSWD